MENKKVRKTVSFVLALVMLVLALPVPITSQAEGTDYTGKIISIAFPRGADRTKKGFDTWGHEELRYINGAVHKENVHTNMQYMEYGDEKICYCIEPGESVSDGDSRTQKDESYFNAMSNKALNGYEIAETLGRLMQYGYTGKVSDSWVSQNTSHAEKMAHAIATQLLVWEVIVGERDVQFNHIEVPEPYNRILDVLSPAHPLHEKVEFYYNDIVSKMKSHTGIPSFMTDEEDNAPTYNFTKVGNQYKCTLIDKNNVLSKFNFDVINISDGKLNNSVTVTKDGNRLILTSNTPVNGIRLEANKIKSEHRSSVVVWHSGSSNEQDVMTVYGEEVSDPISAYAKAEMRVGSIKINKKDNSGKALSGARFNIVSTALGISKTVTTNANGIAEQTDLPFGTYTVTEVQYPTGFKAGSMSVSKGTVVSTTANSATVTLSGSSTEIVINAVNNPKLTTIYGYKSRQNIGTGLTQMSGAVIGLFKQSEIQAYKTANPNATYKEIYNSDRVFKTCVSGSRTTSPDGGEGKVGLYYFTDVPFGNYIIAEISTITGFEAPDERSIRYISIGDNDYNSFNNVAPSVKSIYNDKIRMINDNDTNGNGDKGAIRNYPKYVSIYGFKCRENVGAAPTQISGAVIGLFDKKMVDRYTSVDYKYSEIFTEENAIATCVSGSVKTPYNETNNGCYRFDNLEFGSYVIAEIKAPNGYKEPTEDTIRTIIVDDTLYDSCTNSVTINGLKNKVVQVNQNTTEEEKSYISNTLKTGSITVQKVDENGNPLEGAIFGLYKAYKDGNLRTEYPTDFPSGDVFKRVLTQDGEAVFADIPFGEYFVVELKPPAGFKLPNGVVGKDGKFYSTVTLNNAVKVNETTKDVVINDVVNEPISVTIKAKKVDDKGNPLAGATFELFDNEGNSLETVISDADGIVSFSTVLTTVSSNFYEIKETKAPFGYRPSEIYFRVIPLSNGETRISKFENGVSSNERIQTSDQDALLEFTTFVNEPILGYFEGEKLNENAESLEGVKFGLYVLENETKTLIEETVTDVSGHFEFDELRIDKKYILKEEKTVDGYIKTNNEWLITLDADGWADIEIYKESDDNYSIDGNYVTIYNYPNELIGFKYENEIVYTDDSKTCIDTSKNALEGMNFWLRKNGALPVIVNSDENGIIKFSKISDGEYTIIESGSLGGYIKSDEVFSFKVENGVIGVVTDSSGNIFNTNAQVGDKIIPIDFAFKNIPNKLYGYKTDEYGNGLDGAVISLILLDSTTKEPVGVEYECITYTHEGLAGYFEFSKIPNGDYSLGEKYPPTGYKLSDTSYMINVNGSIITGYETTTNEPYNIGGVAFVNSPNKAVGLKTDHNGEPLEGVEFGIFNDYGEVVQTAVTNELGEFVFSSLSHGFYKVKETQGLLGYDTTDLIYNLVVYKDTGTIHIYSADGELVEKMVFENNPLPCSITVQKTDREQVALEGVSFKLEWSKDGETYNPIKHIDSYDAVEGTTTTLVDENGVIKTDNLGEIVFADLTPNLYYKVTEIEALNGYIAKNEPVYEEYIEISPSPVNAFVGVTNVLSPHKISIEKHNHKGENLADAVFSLEWSQDKINWKPVVYVEEYLGDKGTTTTIVDNSGCSVTDDEGKLSFENIVPDLYYRITEVQAPYGYEIIEPIVFEGFISKEDTTKTHEYEVENKLAPHSISVLKYDENNEPITGARFRLEYSTDNTNWKPVEHTDVFSAEQGKTTTLVTDGEIEVDENGVAKFEGLTPELYYRVVETKCPEGYTLLKEPFYIGYMDISDTLDKTISVNNNPDFVLPFVGGKAKHSFWIIGTTSGVLMIIAFSLLKNLEVKKNEEN